MPVTVPATSERNFTPSSVAFGSPSSASPGLTVPHSEQGQDTATGVPADGVSRLPLSSTARVRIVVDGFPCGIHEYVQLVVPDAGCHVAPPSVETSTPATTPPVSLAVPEMITGVPSVT